MPMTCGEAADLIVGYVLLTNVSPTRLEGLSRKLRAKVVQYSDLTESRRKTFTTHVSGCKQCHKKYLAFLMEVLSWTNSS
jgi:hypothetical protein